MPLGVWHINGQIKWITDYLSFVKMAFLPSILCERCSKRISLFWQPLLVKRVSREGSLICRLTCGTLMGILYGSLPICNLVELTLASCHSIISKKCQELHECFFTMCVFVLLHTLIQCNYGNIIFYKGCSYFCVTSKMCIVLTVTL